VGEFWFSQEDSPLRRWWDGIAKTEENFGHWEFAAVLIFDRRHQPPQPTFLAYALSPAIVGPLREVETTVGVQLQEEPMNGLNTNDGSYPEVAARSVRNASQQNPSPAYGYLRLPADGTFHQKIYLFNTLDEARGWFTALATAPAQAFDYMAVFASPDLSRAVRGLESFGHAVVSGVPQVGNAWPLLLGLPLGALGGYYYRGWRDQHPGQWVPGLSEDSSVSGPWPDADGMFGNQPYVGGPWVDMLGPQVGGPWLDMDDMPGSQPYVGGPWVDRLSPQVSGQWPDADAMFDNSSYVGGPWVDMMDPQVGGPWVDMAGPQVSGPWSDADDMFGNSPYVGAPWVDMLGPQVGGPWRDMGGPQVGDAWRDMVGSQVGGPWVDLLGADVDMRERRRAWQQTRALIESAKREVLEAQARNPAAAWVWSFDSSAPLPGRVTELFSSQVIPFSSVERAQTYMYDRLQTPHIALALFDTFAMGHWPNPVRWTKSDDPAYESLISQRVAEYAPTRTAGDYARRRTTSIGSALEDVKDRARTLALKRGEKVVGVFHATKDQLWHALAFTSEDDAKDWLRTQDPSSFTYAAYFDKNDEVWPQAVDQKIGDFRQSPQTVVGADSEDTQAYAKALATGTQGNAAGVMRSASGAWSTYAFPTLDAAINWLNGLSSRRTSFAYAAIFGKEPDGTAYFQQEEIGARPASWDRRSSALTSAGGGYNWRAA
jgi:hypothetical protein